MLMKQHSSRILFGITGASGAIYARVLLDELVCHGHEIHLVASRNSLIVMCAELDVSFADGRFDASILLGRKPPAGQITVYDDTDMAAPLASGTFHSDGMVICPCSMKTLGLLAGGIGQTLICRAADVCLKEKRRLVIVPRETPLNLIHLRNMTTLCEAGATILPAMPGFYHRPKMLDDIAAHLVMKICGALGLPRSDRHSWTGTAVETV